MMLVFRRARVAWSDDDIPGAFGHGIVHAECPNVVTTVYLLS